MKTICMTILIVWFFAQLYSNYWKRANACPDRAFYIALRELFVFTTKAALLFGSSVFFES